MEYMRTVFMHIYAFYALAIDISAKVWPFIDHKAAFASPVGQMGESRAEQTGTNNQVIILFHFFLNYSWTISFAARFADKFL